MQSLLSQGHYDTQCVNVLIQHSVPVVLQKYKIILCRTLYAYAIQALLTMYVTLLRNVAQKISAYLSGCQEVKL